MNKEEVHLLFYVSKELNEEIKVLNSYINFKYWWTLWFTKHFCTSVTNIHKFLNPKIPFLVGLRPAGSLNIQVRFASEHPICNVKYLMTTTNMLTPNFLSCQILKRWKQTKNQYRDRIRIAYRITVSRL